MNRMLAKAFVSLSCLVLAACAVKPQTLNVSPDLSFPALKGVAIPVQLFVEDKRSNQTVLGYRNAKKEGEITLSDSLSKVVGEKVRAAMQAEGIDLAFTPEPAAKVNIQIDRLDYSTPDESWVGHIEMHSEVLVFIERGNASMKKRFAAQRAQDVATAPTVEFNQDFMNALLTELLNKALNDREVVNFLR